MAYRYAKRKIPYSKMPLSRLKEIETDILSRNPDLDNRLALYREEEKMLLKLKAEHEDIRKKIAEIRNIASDRKQQEYANANSLKKFFMDKTMPSFREPEKAEIEKLQAELAKLGQAYNLNKYHSAYETHERLSRIQALTQKMHLPPINS
jgi:hypothetical protein